MKKRMTWSEMMHVCAPAQAQSGFACPSSARRTADCCAVETILLDTIMMVSIFVILLAGLVLPEILAIPAELIRLAVLAILLVLVVLANRSLVPKEQPLFSF